MSQEASETFLVWDEDGDIQAFRSNEDAREEAVDLVRIHEMGWARVYHLDFTANKMTLIKEYRRRTESDEEGIVEYV